MHIDDKMTLFEMYEIYYEETTAMLEKLNDGLGVDDIPYVQKHGKVIFGIKEKIDKFKELKGWKNN